MYRPVRETLTRGLDARAAACGYTVRALSGYRAAKKELRRGDTAIFIGVLWPGEETGATCATSKAPLSAAFHSLRPIFGRAIIPRSTLEAWMLFPERARGT